MAVALEQQLVFHRWPTDDDELWNFVATIWGIEIPRVRVCSNHVAPFEAFADAFFARHPISIWKASRGLGGKSMLLATLTQTEMVALEADCTILAGSGAQSASVHAYMQKAWNAPLAPRELLASDPSKYATLLRNGGRVRALMASQTSARGPHPQRLRMDEIDEMDLMLLDAALGQPMSSPAVPSQTVLSSTHHHPDGTFTEILQRAKAQGFPIFEWCYRECLKPHGWLDQAEVDLKRATVTSAMFSVEYELQEPTGEARAIDAESVKAMFDESLGRHEGALREYLEFEEPQPGATYATGADWARKTDWTVIVTLRTDVTPYRLVAFERMRRLPWPQMVERLNARVTRYPGSAAHDATGLGDVVAGYLTVPVEDIMLVARLRSDIFSEYIAGIERKDLLAPMIESMEAEHRYATNDDLYGSGHPPDTFVAGALAYRAAKTIDPQFGRDFGIS